VENAHRPNETSDGADPRSKSNIFRVYQLIALVACLCGIVIALQWPGGWGVSIAFAGFVVALMLE